VKGAIGRDGLDNGVCVFKNVIDHRITLEDIEEEDDEVVSPIGKKNTTFKSTFYNLLRSIRKKIGSSSTVTLKLYPIDIKQNLLL